MNDPNESKDKVIKLKTTPIGNKEPLKSWDSFWEYETSVLYIYLCSRCYGLKIKINSFLCSLEPSCPHLFTFLELTLMKYFVVSAE
jgi:hypothetical protein